MPSASLYKPAVLGDDTKDGVKRVSKMCQPKVGIAMRPQICLMRHPKGID